MPADDDCRRFEQLSRTTNERSLTTEESAELGNLVALDMGVSRGPYQPPGLRPRGGSGREYHNLKSKRG